MSCSHKNEPYNRFCTTCGIKLIRVTCLCGASNHFNHSFCGACGSPLQQRGQAEFTPSTYREKPKLTQFLTVGSVDSSRQERNACAVTQNEIDKLFKK